MDVVAVHDAAREAVAWVRSGAGPVFLEFDTYRYRAHSMFDPELYRDEAEVESCRPPAAETSRRQHSRQRRRTSA
jgi:pyruvate dehydrogenase E1 component alpha subunit